MTAARSHSRLATAAAIALLAALLAGLDLFGNARASAAFGLILVTLAALLLAWVPAPLAVLLFMLAVAVSGLVPPEVVFAGFYSSALWLVFGGMLLSYAFTRTGIDRRLAALLDVLPGGTYTRSLCAVALLGLAMILILPTALGRVIIILPIAAAYAERFGFQRGDSGYNGIVSVAVCATFLPAFGVLPANYPNLVIVGMLESLFGVSVSYGQWMLMNFPLFGALNLLLILVVARWLFPAQLGTAAPAGTASEARTPWSRDQRRVVVILTLAVGLWITDSLHGIAAGWIGLAAGLACFIPGLGVMPASEFGKASDMGPALLVAGLLAIGGVTAHTGLAELLAASVTRVIPDWVEGQFPVYMALASTNLAVQFVTTNAALPSVMLPQSAALAQAMGVDLHTVVAAHLAGYCNLPLPYLAGPTLLAMHRGGVSGRGLLALTAAVSALGALLLWPLYYRWLQLLGFI